MQKIFLLTGIATFVAWAVWFYAYYSVSPWNEAGDLELVALLQFLASFGIGVGGISSLVIAWVKSKLNPSWDPVLTLSSSLRQGMFLGGAVVFLMMLSVIRALNYFTGGLSLVSVVALELFFHK